MDLIIFLIFLTVAYFIGTAVEKRHYTSIRRREQELLHLPVRTSKDFSENDYREGILVSGEVVVSLDYFKRILAFLKGLIGGRITAFEPLIDRGRREAVLRMKEEAERLGASEIVNFRLETAAISNRTQAGDSQTIGCIEVYAYGTALKK
ncbi:YbjQ family protein [Bdellovibrionota bacterium]